MKNLIEDRKRMRGQSGFTLIELLVVIAILAVLGGAAVIGIGAMRDNAEEQVCKTDAETIETAAEALSLDDTPAVPVADINNLTIADLVANNYLKADPGNYTGASRASATAPYAVVGTCP